MTMRYISISRLLRYRSQKCMMEAIDAVEVLRMTQRPLCDRSYIKREIPLCFAQWDFLCILVIQCLEFAVAFEIGKQIISKRDQHKDNINTCN